MLPGFPVAHLAMLAMGTGRCLALAFLLFHLLCVGFPQHFLLALISMVSLMPNRVFFCLRFRSGRCGAGAKCKFGHGGAELRPRPRSRSPLRVMEEGELDGADPPSGLPVVKEEGEVSESEAEEERGTHWVWTADPVASAAQRRPVGSLQLVPK